VIRCVVTEASPGTPDINRQRLVAPDFEVVGYARDGLEAAQLAIGLRPDVLLVHEDLPGVSGYRACELVAAATADVATVIVAKTSNDASLRRAMAAGARAVLPQDVAAEQVAQVVREAAGVLQVRSDPEFPMVTDPQLMPRTIAVTAAKGGAGATTVAVNLAALFARRFPDHVALVDFHGHFGDASLALDVVGNTNMGDLAEFEELDPDLVETHLVRHAPTTLRVLSAPDLAAHGDVDMARLSVPFMASLVGILRRSYRYVFYDIPALAWPTGPYVFSRAQRLLVVTTLFDLPTIRNTKAVLEIASAGLGGTERVSVVANRSPWRGDYKLADLESAAGKKAYHELPDDFEAAYRALNVCNPVVLEYPNSALAKSLGALSEKLVAEL
jgi:pilus assembly protein CpaE